MIAERSPVRAAVRLAALAGLALLADPLAGIADTAAAGRLGVSEQAALALGTGIVSVTTWLVVPILFAQTTDVARLYAAGRLGEAARLVRGGLLAASAFGAVLALVLCGIALFAGVPGDTAGFLFARAVGLPVVACVMAGYGALRGALAVRAVTVYALAGAVIHVGLDVGSVAYTDLGVAGLGLASTGAQAIVAVLVIRALYKRGLLSAGAEGTGSHWRSSVSAVGVLATRAAVLGGTLLVMTATAVGIGETAGAAHQVTYQFWLFAVLAVEGWKSAAQILVSSSTSDGDRARTESALVRASVVLGFGGAAVTLAAIPVAGLLAAGPDVAEQARAIWPLAAASLVVGSVAYTRDGIEFGRGEYAANLLRILPGAAVWLIGAGVAYETGELQWIWWGVIAGLALRVLPRPRRATRAPAYGSPAGPSAARRTRSDAGTRGCP
ncbi:MATE family efflux transporter [Solicola gregarius]|uniref:MATE family efflux transporter n=1 Tax=Solicola gregarius TaxID=2908642 RepID=A0AA46YNA2_9ACTN|nr:MATE family efflux transporter [Solicola gregarius]UYM06523.1 MATE family efflux transporter [Solicola gregarius]